MKYIYQNNKFMKSIKYFLITLTLLLSSCFHSEPPSQEAISAGLLSHAGVHNKQRLAGIAYVSSEESTARATGDFTASRWDTYQRGNKVDTIKHAQSVLNEAHAKINDSFPNGKKPFIIP